jgi:hypothetical protein
MNAYSVDSLFKMSRCSLLVEDLSSIPKALGSNLHTDTKAKRYGGTYLYPRTREVEAGGLWV